MSPELLDPDKFGIENSRPTKESDSYALGMVILEVLSGRSPFNQLRDVFVMRVVLEGKRPERPTGPEGAWFTDDLWQMLTLCWKSQRESRPSIAAILECLEKVSGAWKSPPLRMDQAVEMEEEGWDLTRASVSFRDSNPSTVHYGPGAFTWIARLVSCQNRRRLTFNHIWLISKRKAHREDLRQ
jgi:serine/threonine protein kinase